MLSSRSSVWRLALLVLLLGWSAAGLQAQSVPEALRPGISVRQVGGELQGAVRTAHDPVSGALFVLTIGGDVYRFASPFAGAEAELVYTAADHGLSSAVLGMAIAGDGTLYLVGNEAADGLTHAVVVRGRAAADGTRAWTTVARTEPYPRSNTPFDHNVNSIAVSPDGASLYVNSGSRTDHGEVQDNAGRFPGLREVPLTSAIFRIPADGRDLLLRNDDAYLRENGYLFADGTRNSFDLAFDADGRLFGTENAGDRDDAEELNWIREGRHYGFPWRMGMSDTPQQFADYDPAEDPLLNPDAFAVQNGFFHNDPTFPPAPADVVFTEPIRSLGPDAARYRGEDGGIHDASGAPFATFTPHRSPLGLVFDVDGVLPGDLSGDAFVLSWTGEESPLLSPFGDEGEDLLHVELQRQGDDYVARVERLVRGFQNPIDAAMVGSALYVVEYGSAGRVWEIAFAANLTVEGDLPGRGLSATVFPNPASGASRLVLAVEATQRVEVDVYTALGRRVARAYEGVLGGGEAHSLPLEMAGLPAGAYLLRIRGERFSSAQTFVSVGSR